MLFNSYNFLLFFPAVTLLYFMIPQKYSKPYLLAAGYVFYMCWNPRYLLLMAASTVITYAAGISAGKKIPGKTGKTGKTPVKPELIVGLASNLGLLFFFKYYAFAVGNVNVLLDKLNLSLSAPAFDILLPIGISFYTFKALSYLFDVCQGKIAAERNFLNFALYVSFFPQLLAGPIDRAGDLMPQFDEKHPFKFQRVKNGLLRMLWGYFQKMVIADKIAVIVGTVYDNPAESTSPQLIIATFLYAFQILCDFSGYSDMAIGCATVLGFRSAENFRHPYLAASIADFWRRWHITLSSWLRDYVYIPLGGGRVSKLKKYRNILLTFLVSGLWHGADWTCVFWGALHGGYQIAGDLTKGWRDRFYSLAKINPAGAFRKSVGAAVTFLLADIAWIFFRADSLGSAFIIIKKMLSAFPASLLLAKSTYDLGLPKVDFAALLLALAVFAFVGIREHKRETPWLKSLSGRPLPIRWAVYYALIFAVLIFGVYGPRSNPADFIYFQF